MNSITHRYPRYRVNAYRPSTDAPFSQMNTTPLIDVLLVLLIMMIMSIPIATHQVQVDLPGPGTNGVIGPQVSLTIDAAGQARWNGEAVDRTALFARLSSAARQVPEPVIRFEPDAMTGYDDAVQVINLADDAGTGKFAFVGNERHRSFDKGY